MSIWSRILVFIMVAGALSACGEQKPATPLETFITYTKAIKAKDVKAMKLLLSNATLKMHEQEAKAQGVKIDDIIKRETLFTEDQKVATYKDEKIDGDKATLQVKNSYGSWESVPFVREDGAWKIDKQGYADQLMKDVEDSDKKLDDIINGSKPPAN